MTIKGPATIVFDDGAIFEVTVSLNQDANSDMKGTFWCDQALMIAGHHGYATLKVGDDQHPVIITQAGGDGMGTLVSQRI